MTLTSCEKAIATVDQVFAQSEATAQELLRDFPSDRVNGVEYSSSITSARSASCILLVRYLCLQAFREGPKTQGLSNQELYDLASNLLNTTSGTSFFDVMAEKFWTENASISDVMKPEISDIKAMIKKSLKQIHRVLFASEKKPKPKMVQDKDHNGCESVELRLAIKIAEDLAKERLSQ